MHARLRPIGGRSGQGFSLYHDKECESHLTIAHVHGPDRALGLCANPRSKGAKPASKQKVVHVPPGAPSWHACAKWPGRLVWAGRTARVSMDCRVRAQTALAARPRNARLRTQPRVVGRGWVGHGMKVTSANKRGRGAHDGALVTRSVGYKSRSSYPARTGSRSTIIVRDVARLLSGAGVA